MISLRGGFRLRFDDVPSFEKIYKNLILFYLLPVETISKNVF